MFLSKNFLDKEIGASVDKVQALKKDKYDVLVLSGGANEISIIKEDKLQDNLSFGKEVIHESSRKLFELAEKCVNEDKNLQVVFTTRIPRYQPANRDPQSKRANLNEYGNSLYHTLWMENQQSNITICDLNLNCQGILKDERYGKLGMNYNGKIADGIHLRGLKAVRDYTEAYIAMLNPIIKGGKQIPLTSHTKKGKQV